MDFDYYCINCGSYLSKKTIIDHDKFLDNGHTKVNLNNPEDIIENLDFSNDNRSKEEKLLSIAFSNEMDREEQRAPHGVKDFINYLGLEKYDYPAYSDVWSEPGNIIKVVVDNLFALLTKDRQKPEFDALIDSKIKEIKECIQVSLIK